MRGGRHAANRVVVRRARRGAVLLRRRRHRVWPVWFLPKVPDADGGVEEDHPLWVGSSLGKKNATAARRDNDMLAGLGYETTSALPHLCVETRERESLAGPSTPPANGGYLRMSDGPQSWCVGSDYVSLECPNSGGVRVWCVNVTQLEGAAMLPAGHCRNRHGRREANDANCSGSLVWKFARLRLERHRPGRRGRGSLYKQGYFAKLFPSRATHRFPSTTAATWDLAPPRWRTALSRVTQGVSGSRSCDNGVLRNTAM